jgi:DNA replication protein DnaC
VLYWEAHTLLEELADATLDGKRKEFMDLLTTVPLLIIDDLGMRKLPLIAAEELLEIIMRRYERASTLITSNRPVDDWGKPTLQPGFILLPCHPIHARCSLAFQRTEAVP